MQGRSTGNGKAKRVCVEAAGSKWMIERRTDKVREWTGAWLSRNFILIWHEHGHWASSGKREIHEFLCRQDGDPEVWQCGRCDMVVPDTVVGYYNLTTWAFNGQEKG